MRSLFSLIGLSLLIAGCADETNMAPTPAKDNTAVNERDANGTTKTPMDQSNKQADIDLTAKIRETVLEIEDLSVNGRNVKIISNEGNVVLRGPVESAAEKERIGDVAEKIAGEGHVTNELEVVPDAN
ncbi:MAG: BON domain-containing protein [Planctomycetaceae bacterium]|jgi:osmotically-inducible protein OsmY|nr:BON domain-containing protein [Planctomycetaceae bacterium]